MTQSDIRQKIRTHRKNLSQDFISRASQKIANKITHLPAFLNAKHIAYYISHENEIDPAIIIEHARQLKKNFICRLFQIKLNCNFM